MDQTNKRPRIFQTASSLFTCKNVLCKKSTGKTTTHTQEDCNRVNVKCITCDQAWVVCISCQRRFNATKIYLTKKHFEEVHSINNKISSDASVTSAINFSSEVTTTSHNSYSIIEQYLNESSMELNSRQFFTKKAISLPHAVQSLVSQAFALC